MERQLMKRSEIWYHLYPLGFLGAEERNPAPGAVDGPISHRLTDLVGWLDHWVDLGVTALLLGPVFESESHGYDVVDPFRVDRRLGSETDLLHLIDACHQRSLRVGLDMVFNHVGRGHAFFADVVEHGRESARSDWFHIDFDRPGHDGFSYANFEGHGQLVKLSHANAQVLDWAVDVATYWLERGVDALRLDAAYAIPAGFLASFEKRVRAARPDLLLIGEVIHGDYAAIAQASRLTSVTQYELWKAIWSSLNEHNFYELAHALERHIDFCTHFVPWNFVGNHDTTRIASKLRDRRHLPHALAILFTIPGIPAVYAGDEQGAEGRKYNRAGGDAEIRRPLPHHPADLAGDSLFIWQMHRELIALRRARPWLVDGVLKVTELSKRSIAFEVRAQKNLLVTVLNTGERSVSCPLPPGLVLVAGHAVSKLKATELPAQGWGIWSSA
jgi:cyclomaltodextrinase